MRARGAFFCFWMDEWCEIRLKAAGVPIESGHSFQSQAAALGAISECSERETFFERISRLEDN